MTDREMSDDEINHRVYLKLIKERKGRAMMGASNLIKDYCNDVSSAWPIISKNKINIEWDATDDGGHASYWICLDGEEIVKRYYFGTNILREAMIAYLQI